MAEDQKKPVDPKALREETARLIAQSRKLAQKIEEIEALSTELTKRMSELRATRKSSEQQSSD